MGRKLIDLTDRKFGCLTVIESYKTNRKGTFWQCLCNCGNTTVVNSSALKKGQKRCRKCTSYVTNQIHGMSNTKVYHCWESMKSRCYRQKDKSYSRYGGRGIKICDRWLNSFENFLEDMGEPNKNETLDRIDNDGDYTPENCRWADSKTQSNNRRNTTKLTLGEVTHSLSKWSEITGIRADCIRSRLEDGWSIEEALKRPAKARNKRIITFNGVTHSISEWAKITGLSKSCLSHRFQRGWSPNRMLTTPKNLK